MVARRDISSSPVPFLVCLAVLFGASLCFWFTGVDRRGPRRPQISSTPGRTPRPSIQAQTEYAARMTVQGVPDAPVRRLSVWRSGDTLAVDNVAHLTKATPELLDRIRIEQTELVDLRRVMLSHQVREAVLANAHVIKWLRLPPGITAPDLEWVGQLTQVRALCVANAQLGGADLRQLASLTKLAYLDLARSGITESELRALPSFPELEYLRLGARTTTDAVVSCLTSDKLPKLRVLGLTHCTISNESILHLADEFRLEVLHLYATDGIDGDCIPDLGRMTSLRFLGIGFSGLCPGVSRNQNVRDLSKLLPECSIDYAG